MNITHRDVSIDLVADDIFTFNRKIAAVVANDTDKTYMEAIRKYGEENGIDEIITLSEDKLLTIFKLGVAEYERLEAEKKANIKQMEKFGGFYNGTC